MNNRDQQMGGHRSNGSFSRQRLSKGRVAVIMICMVTFIISAALLINYYDNINRAKQATAQLREIYTNDVQPQATAAQPKETPMASAEPAATPAATPAAATDSMQHTADAAPGAQAYVSFAELWPSSYKNNPTLRISSSFEKLRQQNKEIVGWLSIDGVLEEPVLQRDNSYYLTHDATGAENVTGALFLDESCNLRVLPNNLLIHGHNMKEGAMFGSLKKYKVKDASFYKTHPYITFNTLYEEGKYVIFAVSEISISSSDPYYVPFWQFLNFSNQSGFDTYIGKLKELSRFQTAVSVKPGDRILTLATCSGDDENARLLVSARMIREDETAATLKQDISSATLK